MSLIITDRLRNLLISETKEPNLILEIEGLTTKIGARVIGKLPRYGDTDIPAYGGSDDFRYGQLLPILDQQTLISFDGTSTTISQQLNVDKGGSQSTSSITVRLVDINGYATQLITPGQILDDLLGKRAKLYFSIVGASHPDDSVLLLNGLVDDIISGAGYVDLVLRSSDQMKRATLFKKASSALVSDLRYKSTIIQNNILYTQYSWVGGTASIEYTAGATAGAEVVTVTASKVSIQIESGVSTSSQIRSAIINHPIATNIMIVTIRNSASGNTNIAQAETFMETTSTISLENSAAFISPSSPVLRCYARIGDEIIEYTSINHSTNQLLGCTRAQLLTIGEDHKIGDEATSFYRLQDNAIDLTLKLLLSGGPNPWISGVIIDRFVFNTSSSDIYNAIFFRVADVESIYGLTAGDTLTITGASLGANNITDRTISSFGKVEGASYIVVSGAALLSEINTTAVCSFKCKYNVLTEGVALDPDRVDVKQFELVKGFFATQINDCDIYIKENTSSATLIDESILWESGINAIPRKARLSCNITAPPLAFEELKTFDENNVKDPKNLRITRSSRRFFYNHIIWRIEESPIEDKFLVNYIVQSSDSVDLIKIGTIPLEIRAKTLRKTGGTITNIDQSSNRMLERYQYGSEVVEIKTQLNDGFACEIGDAVIFGSPFLKLSDTTTGSREFEPRIWQVINKSMNLKTGDVNLTLLNTPFGLGSRYGIFSCASKLSSGSTLSTILLKTSYGTDEFSNERDKWQNFIGQPIRIHDDNWTYVQESKIDSFDPGSPNGLVLFPALTSLPLEDYIIDLPEYDDSAISAMSVYKSIFVFFNPQVVVVSGIDAFNFTVGVGDIGKFQPKASVKLHSADYSIESNECKISTIIGNTITVSETLGMTPAAGQLVELIGFGDGGAPYKWL